MIRTNWFERWALYSPEKTAIKDDASGVSFSYSDSYRIIRRLAGFLRQHDVRQGDRVAVLSANCIEYLFLFFAVQRLGAVLVPINYRLTAKEVEYILQDCAPKLLVFQDELSKMIAEIDRSRLPATEIPISSALQDCIAGVMRGLSEIDSVYATVPFDHPVMILYTSGTTGRPKGALITNEMMFWNSINTEMRLDITSADVTLTFAPFFHTGGWHVLTTPFLHHGATIIFLSGFHAGRIVELCDTEKVTIFFGVPTMMKMMSETEQFARASFKTVRYAIVGGEPMPIQQIELWQSKGVPIRQGFGLTEVGPNCFSLQEKDAIRKKGSIGFPNFYIETRVVDDAGRDVGIDQPGELLLRGPVVTPGYWNNDEATAAAITDGWFHTGDIVRKDAEGYFFVVDRKKDMFISGAENVYPAEVERVLYLHPAVREVAVVGVPDPKWGEVGKAFVALRPSEHVSGEELIDFCSDKLAKYKIPRYVEFLGELPKGPSGKILKRTLKQ